MSDSAGFSSDNSGELMSEPSPISTTSSMSSRSAAKLKRRSLMKSKNKSSKNKSKSQRKKKALKKQQKQSKSIYRVFAGVTLAKLLMVQCYHSTDFEVHRNWMALTHSLPLEQWYTDESSPWTLDYPPLFAWFERFLSHIGVLIDPNMVQLDNLNYSSFATILFQRTTVIIGDLVLWSSLLSFCNTWPKSRFRQKSNPLWEAFSDRKRTAVLIITLTNAGLFMVDHIHFQYNGLLIGLFIFSVSAVRSKHELLAAVLHSVLLNFKHIFLYVSPLFFVYLLSYYCCIENPKMTRSWEEFRIQLSNRTFTFRWSRLLGLVLLLGMIFGVSLGPFMALGQFWNMMGRLFPFDRGLTHAYWAPNLWAIYNTADVLLTRLLPANMASVFGDTNHSTSLLDGRGGGGSATTRGLIGSAFRASRLPTVTSRHCAILTLLTMSPVLKTVWHRPHPKAFLQASLYILMCAFMCGFHAHEKAILMITIPLSCAALESQRAANLCFVLNVAANCSLLPLLPEIQETPIKLMLLVIHTVLIYIVLDNEVRAAQKAKRIHQTGLKQPKLVWIYLIGFVPVIVFYSVLQPLFLPKYEFLPLMLFSFYSALGFVYCWYLSYLLFAETHFKIFQRKSALT